MDANLILRAMTLRGVGSYLHGSRLEFRPLTILCGTNGSGKSTWFKSLNFLKKSLKDREFPLACPNFPVPVGEVDATNGAVFILQEDNSPASFFDKRQEREFGPPCTIGLQFEATADFELDEVAPNDGNL